MSELASLKKPHPYADAPTLPAVGPVDVSTLTRSSLPLEIEIGPGRGAFILERAAETSTVAVVGLEIRYKWAKIVDDRLTRVGFGDRARVYAADARFLLPRLQPDASVTRFYVHFPDPWWKKRQQKRLVVTPTFVREMVRLLVPGGTVFVQTDVLERGEQYETLLSSMEGLLPDGDETGSPMMSETPWRAKSNRERRVMAAGLVPARLRFRKP
jgi:tRNA (guanine-N7-)-methyltransferase